MQSLVALAFCVFFAVMTPSDAHRFSPPMMLEQFADFKQRRKGQVQIAEVASLDSSSTGQSLSCDKLCHVSKDQKECTITTGAWVSSMGSAIYGWASNALAKVEDRDGIEHGEIIQELLNFGWCDIDNCMPEFVDQPTTCISTEAWKRENKVEPPAEDIVQITAIKKSRPSESSSTAPSTEAPSKVVVPVAVNLDKARFREGITESQITEVRTALGEVYVTCQDFTGNDRDGCCIKQCFAELSEGIKSLGGGIKASCVKGCLAYEEP